jgi:hypothetical protein
MDTNLFNNEIEQIEHKLSESISFLSTLNHRLPLGRGAKQTLNQQLTDIDNQLLMLIQSLEIES